MTSAADPKIADELRSQASRLDRGRTVPVTDVVPAAAKDPEGSGALTTLLPLVLLSIALGVAIAFAERRRGWCVAWCVAAASVAGLAVAGLAHALGTFPDGYWGNAGTGPPLACCCSPSASDRAHLHGDAG